MPAKNKKNREVRFKYLFDEDYSPEYVNGAYGGVNTRGEIILNFFLERTPVPRNIFHEVRDNGALGDETNRHPEDIKNLFIRHVQQGIVLNIENAVEIRNFLTNAIEHAEKFNKQKGEIND